MYYILINSSKLSVAASFLCKEKLISQNKKNKNKNTNNCHMSNCDLSGVCTVNSSKHVIVSSCCRSRDGGLHTPSVENMVDRFAYHVEFCPMRKELRTGRSDL